MKVYKYVGDCFLATREDFGHGVKKKYLIIYNFSFLKMKYNKIKEYYI